LSQTLTLAFLQRRPQSAAGVIEDLDPSDGAAFLATVPGRIGAPVVAFMAPWAGARCVELFPADRAASLIRNMSYQDGTTLLRLISKDRIDAILKQLPKRLARDFTNSLAYPSGSVGAWMDYGIPLFEPGNTVADGLKFAKLGGGRRDLHIFVGNSRRELVGAVSMGDLVRSEPQTKLSEIMDPGVQALSNRATLASVAEQPQWDDYPMLPVIGRRKQVLGGLSRSSLSKGLEEDRVFRPGLAPSSVLTELFVGYFVTCSGLLRLVSEPASPKQEPES